MVQEFSADGIVCDDELSPAQMKNLEDALGCKIMDRTMVILDIYAIGEDAKSIAFTFMLGQLKLNSTVEYMSKSMNITFDADKVLAIVKNLSAAVSQYGNSQTSSSSSISSTLQLVKSLSALLEGFNGMRLGVKVSK